MGKIFADRNIKPDGLVLPYEECKLFSDMASTKIVPEKAQLLIQTAEQYLDEEIPLLPLSIYREFWISGSRTDFQRPYYKRRDMLYPMIFAEYIEGKGRFIDKIADLVWCILEESSWVIHAHSSHTPMNNGSSVPVVYRDSDIDGIDLFSAMTGAIMTAALVYCRDGLDKISPIICERIEHELERRIIKPFLTVIFSWSGEFGKRPNNWCPWIVSNVLYVTALVEKDIRSRTAVVRRAMKYLDNYTAGQPEDGGCDEGPSYWGAAGAALFDSLELIYDMTGGKINVFDDEQLRRIGEFEPTVNIHDDRYFNFGDCGSLFYPNGYMIARFGKRCGSEMLEAFGKVLTNKCSLLPGNRHVYRSIKDMMTSPYAECEGTKAPLKAYLPSLNLMIARESEDSGHGLYIGMKGGNNKASHNHNDVGSFIVYRNGKPVIIDPGTVRYTRDTFGSKRYTIWCMQSHYHNLPAFDGFGEVNGIEYKSTREVYDEESGKISFGLEEAYDKAAGVEEYTRSAVLTNGVITIEENIRLDTEREIDFRFMLSREPKQIEDGRIELTEGCIFEYDRRLKYTFEEFAPDNVNFQSKWGTDVLYRMHFSTKAKELSCKFTIS